MNIYMDMEACENLTEDERNVRNTLGFLSLSYFNEYKNDAIAGMKIYGSDFFQCYAEALERSNFNDSVKMVSIFRSKCDEYSIIYKSKIAIEKAENK